MVRLRHSSVLWTLGALVVGAAPAAAQAPNLGFVYPPAVQAGSQVTVNVNGGNLQGATTVLLSAEGVKARIANATNAAALPLELTVEPGALPGVREVRVATPGGVSNAGRIWVSGYPGVNETEPNNTLAAAQKLEKLPATINGQVNGAEDVDQFTFQAAAGETWVFDLAANRIASPLDGYLVLQDARGKNLQTVQEGFDRDPRIIHTFKQSGTYTILVRDTLFRNGGNFVYALTAGRVPVVTGFLPVGGRRGATVQLSLEGVNLGGMRTATVQMPAEGSELLISPSTPAGALASPLALQVSDADESVEAEPNDTPARATPVAGVPVVLNGRIDRPGDVDIYRIRPAAAGNLQFDLFGRRIGSRIESELRLLDAAGKQIQTNDDADGKDSRLVAGVQAGTEYLVEVRTRDQSAGGEAYYRLEIAPPGAPDFRLTVTPDELNLGQGGSIPVTVNLTRLNGFGGAVDLRVEGLPAGVTVSRAFIPAGQNSAQFTLTAAPDAAPGSLGLIRLLGAAKIGEAQVERAAVPVEIYRAPLAAENQNSQRPALIFAAAVGPAPAYTLDLEQREVTVKKGQSVQIKIRAKRQMAATQQINITVAGQPANVNPMLANIAEKTDEVTITLAVAANAPTVTQNLVISGNLANNVQVAPALTLTITD